MLANMIGEPRRVYVYLGAMVAVLAALLMLAVGSARADFGIAAFDGQATIDEAGGVSTQAGEHPYAISTEIEFNQHTDPAFGSPVPDSIAKDIVVDLPAGLVGNPSSAAKCSPAELVGTSPTSGAVTLSECPLASQVGFVQLNSAGNLIALPLYSMQTPPTVPARFGFNLIGVVVFLDATVRSNGDYGLSVGGHNISEAVALDGIQVTIWGVPADPSHDADRCRFLHFGAVAGPLCEGEAGTFFGPHSAGRPPVAFLTQPTRCSEPGGGPETRLRADSWANPGVFQEAGFMSHEQPNFPATPGERGAVVGIAGCDRVPFEPSIHVAPSSSAADSPTGLNVALSVPTDGLENPVGIAQSDLRRAVVRLPLGMAVNPSSAGGLGACSPAQIALSSTAAAGCPDNSRIGTVRVDTPLLEAPLEGSIFLASQGDNPFGSLLALYLVAEGSGVVLKLPGKIEADAVSGQLTAVFDDLPQLPFSRLDLAFKTGPRAPLVTPPSCGEKTVTSELTGWNGKTVVLSNSFGVDCSAGAGGFAPGFSAGTTNAQAGGFSPFSVTLTRGDAEQSLGGISLRMPPGLLGVLKNVPLCGDAQATAGSCGAESLIGSTTVGAGAGPDPFFLTGREYLTGPYKGAPFGLSIVVPAVAGPFNLGTVVVRASIAVDPHTAQLTITSDPLPRILQGIPLDLRVVNVAVSRDAFTFNPTDCEALSIGATVLSGEGASAEVSSPFQAANCAALGFAPKFSASTLARTSRQNGAALDVKVAYPGGAQANIRSVAVALPRQLPARLSTIQQACPAATFEKNPASCGEGALIGIGTAFTPILSTPLTGPAYLVSNGGAAFPDIIVVLQGQGITLDLVGNVNISKAGVTSATFAHIPDAPISSFELNLPQGPHSGLSAVGSLCVPLSMPTTITAQNGAVIKQATKIKVTGCSTTKKKHKAKRKHHKKHKKHKARKGSTRNGR